jgi:hypothetical protein
MDNSPSTFWEIVSKGWAYVGLALLGSAAVTAASDKPINLKIVLASFLGAAFVGMIMHLLLYDVDLPESLKGAAVGMSGASSYACLEVMRRFLPGILEKVLNKMDKIING